MNAYRTETEWRNFNQDVNGTFERDGTTGKDQEESAAAKAQATLFANGLENARRTCRGSRVTSSNEATLAAGLIGAAQ
jgi:hypothetical protein